MESLPDARAAAPTRPDTLPSITSRNEALARLTQLAASLLDVPCAMLLRIHADRYEVRSSYVTKQALANQAETLFPAVVASGGAFLLDDSLLGGEEEGADSNGYTLKFLYCVPVTSETGALLGTLCLADARSHPLDDTSQHLLSNLATMISMELVHRDTQEAGETGAEPAPEERDDAYNKAWWNLLVENNPTPLLIARGDVVLYMNRAGLALAGAATLAQVKGQPVSRLLHPTRSREEGIRYLAQRLSTSGDGAADMHEDEGPQQSPSPWIQWAYPGRQPARAPNKDSHSLAEAMYYGSSEDARSLADAPDEDFLNDVRVYAARASIYRLPSQKDTREKAIDGPKLRSNTP